MDTLMVHDTDMQTLRIPGHVQDISVRLLRPRVLAGLALPVLLYLHGGGFTAASGQADGDAMRHLATAVPALVVAVDYSLAPAHPFPAALYDAAAALRWVRAQARGLEVDASRLGLAGVDAGGHIAASLALCNRDQGGDTVRALALAAPLLDPSMTRLGDTPATVAGGDALARYNRCYQAYLPHPTDRLHPYAAPLDCRRLTGLPPTLVLTAAADILRQEAEAFADRLDDAGVPVEATRFPGVDHAGLLTHPPVLAALSAFFRRRLAPIHR